MSKRTLSPEQKAKMAAGRAKANLAKKALANWHVDMPMKATPDAGKLPPIELGPDRLAGAIVGQQMVAKDVANAGQILENGRQETLKVTRVTETKVFAGSRGFLKTTGQEEGLPEGVEVQATLLATPAGEAEEATMTKTKKKAAPKAKVGERGPKKLGQLDAAAQILGNRTVPMNCKELVEVMVEKGLWSSPGGATPHATLSAAIGKEIATKGKDSRFKKVSPGHYLRA